MERKKVTHNRHNLSLEPTSGGRFTPAATAQLSLAVMLHECIHLYGNVNVGTTGLCLGESI